MAAAQTESLLPTLEGADGGGQEQKLAVQIAAGLSEALSLLCLPPASERHFSIDRGTGGPSFPPLRVTR